VGSLEERRKGFPLLNKDSPPPGYRLVVLFPTALLDWALKGSDSQLKQSTSIRWEEGAFWLGARTGNRLQKGESSEELACTDWYLEDGARLLSGRNTNSPSSRQRFSPGLPPLTVTQKEPTNIRFFPF